MQVNDGLGGGIAGSAGCLDRMEPPGPHHRFTVSKSGRDSLRQNGGTARQNLSPAAMGTNVHPGRNLNHAFPKPVVLAMFPPAFMIPGPAHVQFVFPDQEPGRAAACLRRHAGGRPGTDRHFRQACPGPRGGTMNGATAGLSARFGEGIVAEKTNIPCGLPRGRITSHKSGGGTGKHDDRPHDHLRFPGDSAR